MKYKKEEKEQEIKLETKKKTLKESFIELLHSPRDLIILGIPLLFLIMTLIPVPYYITAGGGTINISDRIEIANSYSEEGSLNSAYVKELRGNVFTYLLSLVVPSFEATKTEDVVLEEESKEDYNFREKLELTMSNNNAVKVAYEALGKEVRVKSSTIYIGYLDPDAKTDLKVQDIILEVEGEEVFNKADLDSLLANYSLGDQVEFTVLRDDEEVKCQAEKFLLNDAYKFGLYIIEVNEYETSPEVSFNFKDNESGPSGGLMMTLSIYNKLTEEDITKGRKIVGTGTIDEEGNVGEIGGVKYKIMGAVSAKADLFLVPVGNYEEAVSFAEEKGYDIPIIPVATFDEALQALET